jgi:hypothetical protein
MTTLAPVRVNALSALTPVLSLAWAIREGMLKSVPDGCNLIESGCLGSINV